MQRYDLRHVIKSKYTGYQHDAISGGRKKNKMERQYNVNDKERSLKEKYSKKEMVKQKDSYQQKCEK